MSRSFSCEIKPLQDRRPGEAPGGLGRVTVAGDELLIEDSTGAVVRFPVASHTKISVALLEVIAKAGISST